MRAETSAFPATRYRGSKSRRLAPLERAFAGLELDTALDLFGGTGAVSFLLKRLGKTVTFNDALASSHAAGVALIENASTRLDPERASELFLPSEARSYGDTVARIFDDVFFLPDENRWIDVVAQNTLALADRFERALASWALGQACLMKRPFNLFHRRNLALRTREVTRSFGNKSTWERPFEELFLGALGGANAAVFDNGRPNRASSFDALACPVEADLVYLDPPYVRSDGEAFDYGDAYHFLDGLAEYPAWEGRIDRSKKHLPLARPRSPFSDPRTVTDALFTVLERAAGAHIVLSYRDDGVPSIEAIAGALKKLGRTVEVMTDAPRAYALSRRASREVTIVAPRPR